MSADPRSPATAWHACPVPPGVDINITEQFPDPLRKMGKTLPSSSSEFCNTHLRESVSDTVFENRQGTGEEEDDAGCGGLGSPEITVRSWVWVP
jgi:hypothetical protein